MTYENLKEKLNRYNWDDGFTVPKQIISDVNCDLALALEVFYLSDGFVYLQNMISGIERNNEWNDFVAALYCDIESGKYIKTGNQFEIPLSKVQKYKLLKSNVPSVFLTDL